MGEGGGRGTTEVARHHQVAKRLIHGGSGNTIEVTGHHRGLESRHH